MNDTESSNVTEAGSDEAELKRVEEEIGQKEILLNYISEATDRYRQKYELRQINQTVSKSNDSVTGKLDSSVKRNTAFVRKLRNFTAPQLQYLLRDMSSLNLTNYISEVASALVDSN